MARTTSLTKGRAFSSSILVKFLAQWRRINVNITSFMLHELPL